MLVVCAIVAYTELCPGGPGFRPNVFTVILEGLYAVILSAKYQLLLLKMFYNVLWQCLNSSAITLPSGMFFVISFIINVIEDLSLVFN